MHVYPQNCMCWGEYMSKKYVYICLFIYLFMTKSHRISEILKMNIERKQEGHKVFKHFVLVRRHFKICLFSLIVLRINFNFLFFFHKYLLCFVWSLVFLITCYPHRHRLSMGFPLWLEFIFLFMVLSWSLVQLHTGLMPCLANSAL